MADKSLTFKLFGRDVSASKALKGIGKSAKYTGSVVGGLAAMDMGRRLASFAGETVNAFGNLGGETLKLQRYIGGSAEEASRLSHAFTMTGIDSATAGKSLGIMSKFVSNAGDQLDQFQSKQAAAAASGKPFNGVLTGSAAALATLGVSIRNTDGTTRSTSAILGDFAEQFKDMPAGVDKTSLILKVFGKNGMAMMPFLNKGAKGIAELTKQSDELGTTLSGSDLDAVKENTKAKRTFGEAIKGLQVSVGRELFPIMTKFTAFLSGTLVPIIRTVIGWMRDHKDIVTILAGAIGVIIAGFKLWSITMAIFNAIAAANPISLIVIALAALVAGLIYAYNNFEGFRNVVQAVWGAIQTAVGTVVSWFQETVWPVLRAVIGFIIGYYRFLFTVMKAVWTAIWNVIRGVVEWFATTVWPKLRAVIGFIVGYYKFLFTALKTVWTGIASAIGAVVSWFAETAWPKIQRAIGVIKTGFGILWTAVKTVWEDIWSKVSGVVEKLTGAASTISTVFSNVWGGVSAAAKTAFNGVASAWNNTVGSLSWQVPDWVPLIGGNMISAPRIPMLAAGGIVTGPTLAMIGEGGPEAVIPLSRGAGYGIGGGVTVNVYVQGDSDPAGAARRIGAILDRGITSGAWRPAKLVTR